MRTQLTGAYRLVFDISPDKDLDDHVLVSMLLDEMPKVLSCLGYEVGRWIIYLAIAEIDWPTEDLRKENLDLARRHAVEEVYFEFTDPAHHASENLDPDFDMIVALYRGRKEECERAVKEALSGFVTP